MKALFPRATVLKAALRAVAYHQAAFDNRKERWIAETAAMLWRDRFFAKRLPFGKRRAAEAFHAWPPFMSSDDAPRYGCEGSTWNELHALCAAESLVRRASVKGAAKVILSGEEIDVLRPVMELAAA